MKDGDLVLSVTLKLSRGDAEIARERLRDIVRWRREHQPGGANGGSVFRNPPGDYAARLIEATGCKGLRVGERVGEREAHQLHPSKSRRPRERRPRAYRTRTHPRVQRDGRGADNGESIYWFRACAMSRARGNTAPPTAPPTAPRRATPVASREARPRRRLRRLTKWLLSLGLIVTALALGAQWILHQSFFRVQSVQFIGLRHESSAAALSVSGLSTHPPMIDVSDAQIKERLSSFPWIDTVKVTKRWPHSLVVTVARECRGRGRVRTEKRVGVRFVEWARTWASTPALEPAHVGVFINKKSRMAV